MEAHEQSPSNPYSAPTEVAVEKPDYDTTYEESTIINSAIFRAANRIHAGKRYFIRRTILLVGGPLVLALGSFAVYRGIRTLLSTMLLVLGCYATIKGLAFDWFSQRLTKRMFGRMALSEKTVHFTVEPEWLGFMENDAESRIRYTVFLKWRKGEKQVLLYRSKVLYQIVPIDQFSFEAHSALICRLTKFLGPPQ